MNNLHNQKTLRVSVAMIHCPKRGILLAKRQAKQSFAHFWEFPGGKIDPGEDSLTAIRRECKEEVALDLTKCDQIMHYSVAYPDRPHEFHVWYCDEFTGDPRGCEGQEVQWVALEQVEQYNMPPANQLMLDALKRQIKSRKHSV